MNYNDYAPPHVPIKYQRDVHSYRLEIRTRSWLKPGKELPLSLRKLVEAWQELLEQWEHARNNQPVVIVG